MFNYDFEIKILNGLILIWCDFSYRRNDNPKSCRTYV